MSSIFYSFLLTKQAFMLIKIYDSFKHENFIKPLKNLNFTPFKESSKRGSKIQISFDRYFLNFLLTVIFQLKNHVTKHRSGQLVIHKLKSCNPKSFSNFTHN